MASEPGNDPTIGYPAFGTALWVAGDSFLCARPFKVSPPKADTFDREVIAALTGEPVFHSPLNDAVHNSCQPQVPVFLSMGQFGEAG